MTEENTNWCQSVGGVVLKDGKVLLARHTYGAGKGKLIIPGGYVQMGESPEDALKREFLEETGIQIAPKGIIGIRFNAKDWYVVFAADYVSGVARSDRDENDLVVWLPVADALINPLVPGLTKQLISCAVRSDSRLIPTEYESIQANPGRLYAVLIDENNRKQRFFPANAKDNTGVSGEAGTPLYNIFPDSALTNKSCIAKVDMVVSARHADTNGGNSMRISVQNTRLADFYGIDESFKLLHDVGFQGVDFNLNKWFNSAMIRDDAPAPMDQPLDALYEIFRPYNEAAARHQMVVSQTHSPFPSWLPEKDALNARVLEGQKKTIALTAYVGSKYCVIHPAFHPESTKRFSAKEEWELNRDMYGALIPTLREHHVVACLENMFTGGPEGMRYAAACSDFHQAAEWVDRLNDMAGEELFGFCFDAGHCLLTGQDMRYSLNIIGKRLKVLHINDNNGHIDWHVAPYMGVGNWESFIAGLRDIGYDGDLSFETFNVLNRYPEPMWRTALQLIAETGAYFEKRIKE